MHLVDFVKTHTRINLLFVSTLYFGGFASIEKDALSDLLFLHVFVKVYLWLWEVDMTLIVVLMHKTRWSFIQG